MVAQMLQYILLVFFELCDDNDDVLFRWRRPETLFLQESKQWRRSKNYEICATTISFLN